MFSSTSRGGGGRRRRRPLLPHPRLVTSQTSQEVDLAQDPSPSLEVMLYVSVGIQAHRCVPVKGCLLRVAGLWRSSVVIGSVRARARARASRRITCVPSRNLSFKRWTARLSVPRSPVDAHCVKELNQLGPHTSCRKTSRRPPDFPIPLPLPLPNPRAGSRPCELFFFSGPAALLSC